MHTYRLRRLLAAALLGGAATLACAQPTLTPAQAAYVKAESRGVEDRFVAEVAGVVGVSVERVRSAMPDERRITVAVERLMAALEKDLGRPLDAAQEAAIRAADERRRRELAALRSRAMQR